MWRICRNLSSALLLLVAFTASDVLAERSKVRVVFEVEVPGYTARWKSSGAIGTLKEDLIAAVQPRLEEEFAFLDWGGRDEGEQTLVLTVQEDPGSPRAPGLRPWVLVTKLGHHRAAPIRIFDADKVVRHLPRTDLAKAAERVVDFVRQKLHDAQGKEAWTRDVVEKVLSAVPLASDIEPYAGGRAVLIKPYADLQAASESRIKARFESVPVVGEAVVLELKLSPQTARIGGTECSIVDENTRFPTAAERAQYIQRRDRAKPIAIGMILYVRLDGPRRSQDIHQVRQ